MCFCGYEGMQRGGGCQSGRCRDRGDAPGPTTGLERSPQRLITRQNVSDVKREREELHVSASFTGRVCVCVCVRQRSSAASSPPQSSVLKSPFKRLYENSSCFQTDLFWEIGCLASLIFLCPPPYIRAYLDEDFEKTEENIGKLLEQINTHGSPSNTLRLFLFKIEP